MSDLQAVSVAFEPCAHACGGTCPGEEICGAETPGMHGALELLGSLFAVIVTTARNPARVAEWLGERGFNCWIDIGATRDARTAWNETGYVFVTDRAFPVIASAGEDFTGWPQALAAIAAASGPEVREKAAHLAAGSTPCPA